MHKYVGTKHSSKTMAQALVLGRWLSQKTPDKHVSILSFTNTLPIHLAKRWNILLRLAPAKQEPVPPFTFFSLGFFVSTSTPQNKI